MNRHRPEPSGSNNGGGLLLAVLAIGAVVWLTIQQPTTEPAPPQEITVNVEAPVIEGDTITVEPAPVTPAEVTVNVAAVGAVLWVPAVAFAVGAGIETAHPEWTAGPKPPDSSSRRSNDERPSLDSPGGWWLLAAGGLPTMPPVAAGGAGQGPVSGVPYAELFNRSGTDHGIDPALLAAVASVESDYQPDVTSGKGAQGLMQFMLRPLRL